MSTHSTSKHICSWTVRAQTVFCIACMGVCRGLSTTFQCLFPPRKHCSRKKEHPAAAHIGGFMTSAFERPTGLFRVRGIIHPPGISLTNGPILKPFEVVIVHSPGFCLVYLDGLHVGNYPSKICHNFWTDFRTLRNIPSILPEKVSL